MDLPQNYNDKISWQIYWQYLWINYAKRLPDQKNSEWPVRYLIDYPCYHPSVNNRIVIGTSFSDCITQFFLCDDYGLSNPYNIDAAINWRKNPEIFLKINKELIGNYRYTLQI